MGGDPATTQVVLPGWISSVVEGGSNSSGEFLTKGTVIIKENFCVSKTLSREWVFMNAQQKIKGKMEKFWGLSGRTLPRFSGVCFCRSVTMMECLCRVCTGFRSAGKMCHWDL